MRRTYWLFSLALLALGGAARAEQVSYTLVPIGTLGGTVSVGSDGVAVGSSRNASAAWRGYSFAGGVMTDLGTLGGTFSFANGINLHGTITGAASIAGDGETHAVVWNEFGIIDLGTIAGYKSAQGLGINKHGAVVGEANLRPAGGFALPNSQAFYVGTSGMVSLPTLGGRYSRATRISEKDVIVGLAELATSADVHAVIWQPAKHGGWLITDLGTLPGYSSSAANALNKHGVTIGWSFNSALTQASAFRYRNSMEELPGLGGTRSAAAGINDHNVVVGWSDLPVIGTRHAVMWDSAGNITDLNAFLPAGSGWVLNNAASISHHGDIVGTGTDPLGRTRAFILMKNHGK